MQNKLEIKALNSDYQRLINKWIERQNKYNEVVNIISMKQDLEKSTEALEIKEEMIYSRILEIEETLPKREVKNAKKGFVKFFGYEV